jgi:hypothetical protein
MVRIVPVSGWLRSSLAGMRLQRLRVAVKLGRYLMVTSRGR